MTLAIAVAVVLTGCGVPSHGVERLNPATVPFHLLDTSGPSSSPQVQGPQTSVYLVADGRLTAVRRRVIGENVPAEAVRSMLAGPMVAESAAGVTTDVPAQTRLVSLDLSGTVATVDMSAEFGTVGGSDQVLAVAQIVYTLTASPFISAVRFAINGKPIEVPDDSGSLSFSPRTRLDYRAVAPR